MIVWTGRNFEFKLIEPEEVSSFKYIKKNCRLNIFTSNRIKRHNEFFLKTYINAFFKLLESKVFKICRFFK